MSDVIKGWFSIIETLAGWGVRPEQVPPEDRPNIEAIRAALGYVTGEALEYLDPLPDSMVPHGGSIVMEWNKDGAVNIAEFDHNGEVAERTIGGSQP